MRLVSGVIGLAVWEFSWFIGYIVLSSPFDLTIGAINGSGGTDYVNTQLASSYTLVSAVFGVCFAIAMIGGVLWFLLWVARREYEEEQYRY